METMTDTFGLEMVLITMDIYIQFLLYLYMIIWQVVVRYDIVSNAVLYLSLLVELIVVLGQFVYMCYRCDASYNEVIAVDVSCLDGNNAVKMNSV